MPPSNRSDFFAMPPLDLENKLFAPTARLYEQTGLQLQALYLDIRAALITAHNVVATAAKQVYDQPIPTLTAWYEQTVQTSAHFYAQTQAWLQPAYQNGLTRLTAAKVKLDQSWQIFWDNPEQATLAALEPVSHYVVTVSEQSSRYWQAFIDNPEQFIVQAFAPLTVYLTDFSNAAEAALISGYYALADLFGLLLEQPVATAQALYHNLLTSLLDSYFGIVSSLLTIA